MPHIPIGPLKGLTPNQKEEADALLLILSMAERHQRWPLFTELLRFAREAGAKFAYIRPGEYALEVH